MISVNGTIYQKSIIIDYLIMASTAFKKSNKSSNSASPNDFNTKYN